MTRTAPYRVLVIGSRTWRNFEPVYAALDELLRQHPDMVLIHGACREGVDAIADRWAIRRGVTGEDRLWRLAAPWKVHGKAAGGLRNQEMVDRRPDVCVAFIDPCVSQICRRQSVHGSHGGEDCVRRARKARIRTVAVRSWEPRPGQPALFGRPS
ncbi:DUF2493 domain-containing protein [Thermomonospora umbrina]|uniref:Uncharacterized protein DUF2493 n=1 Tax=Thermomonospora umbrina TaxID=111806 RepID=A0A3D9T1R7_9ACTN|nr:DUF2493 domain-containing protein [Thermomonospora umbrina]REF00274.1 uncharacterized protein DUF2493 [Thermomonospora umbrina]